MWIFTICGLIIMTPFLRNSLEHLFVHLSCWTFEYLWYMISANVMLALLLQYRKWNIKPLSLRWNGLKYLPFLLLTVRAQERTTCDFFNDSTCIDNPQSYASLGNHSRAENQCTIFGTAYVDGVEEGLPLPGQYLPMSTQEAFDRGFQNSLKNWTTENQQLMAEYCPYLSSNINSLLCCDQDQFETMANQISIISPNCGPCADNLRNTICQFTCSPHQSLFVDVKQIRLAPGDAAHADIVYRAIESMTVYASADMARDVYDFCQADSFFDFVCPRDSCFSGMDTWRSMGKYGLGDLASPQDIAFITMDNMTLEEQQENICSCEDFNDGPVNCIRPLNIQLNTCSSACKGNCADDGTPRIYTEACFGDANSKQNSSGPGQENDPTVLLKARLEENMVVDFDLFNLILVLCVVALLLLLLVLRVFHLRRPNTTTPPMESMYPVSRADSYIGNVMGRWGYFVSKGWNPIFAIIVCLVVVTIMSTGLIFLETENEPVKLWVTQTSEAFENRQRYGEMFHPFYRTEQIILIPRDGGSIGRSNYLEEAIRIQEKIATFKTSAFNSSYPDGISLGDICWKATGSGCTVNSITQYFQNNLTHFQHYQESDTVQRHFETCLSNPKLGTGDAESCQRMNNVPDYLDKCSCFSNYGAPMDKLNTYVGGFPESAKSNQKDYALAKAIISSALVYNYQDDERNELAIHWEREFVNLMEQENVDNALFQISYMAEISIEDEIKIVTSTNTDPIVLSYFLMLLYVTLWLGKWSSRSQYWINAKFSVGFVGVLVVGGSVSSTFGLFSYFGIKTQLVIMEVVPFLTLAIGVDNIFLLVSAAAVAQRELRQQHFSSNHIEMQVSDIIQTTMARVGPGIFMATFTESIAFLFGAISPMPAVKWFAIFASFAVLMNFFLQCTLFVAILALDKRRELKKYPDLLCCRRGRDNEEPEMEFESGYDMQPPMLPATFSDKMVRDYGVFISNVYCKGFLLVFWILWLGLSLYSAQNLNQGLPQQEAMPSNSYMIDHFDNLDKYLATGPPIYFVVESGYGANPTSYNFSTTADTEPFCSSRQLCRENSLPVLLNTLGQDAALSRISPGNVYSWLDDFWSFSRPSGTCCFVQDDIFVPFGNSSVHDRCLPLGTDIPPMPESSFMPLFNMFATAMAGQDCQFGGGSIYQGQFSIDGAPVPESPVSGWSRTSSKGQTLSAFSYMTLSEACPTQADFIKTYKQANVIADWLSSTTGVSVWAYSSFFVFFDQYLTIVWDSTLLLCGALVAIFVMHGLYFWTLYIPVLVTATIGSIVFCVLGLMGPLDIMLNGLSMVNLIIAAGISVEFCSHFARSFVAARGDGNTRMKSALQDMMQSILFGITLTKIIGLMALTLVDSQVFRKYYFRMYMVIVLVGALHGLVLLPVLMSAVYDLFWPTPKLSLDNVEDQNENCGAFVSQATPTSVKTN